MFEGILYYHLYQTEKSLAILKAIELVPANPPYSWAYFTGYSPKEGFPELNGIRDYYLGLCYIAKGETFYSRAFHLISKAEKEGIIIEQKVSEQLEFMTPAFNLKNQSLWHYYLKYPTTKRNSANTLEADALFENRKTEMALGLYSKIINQDSSNVYAYVRLSECLQLMKQQNKALEIYEVAYRKFPKNNQS